jgi:hypothetical protein
MMAMRLPCCAQCRLMLQLGESVVFRRDGRVEHVACPEVICPLCHRAIVPGRPIRRDGEQILHPNCWLKRYRSRAALP